MKEIIVNQFFTVGDLLFEMPIFDEYVEEGYKVTWGVNDNLLPLAKHFPHINFMPKDSVGIDYSRRDVYEIGEATVLPMRFTDSIMKVPYTLCMWSKYGFVGKDISEWRKLKWVRDTESENRLFYDVLKLTDGEKYNLINRNFRFNSSGHSEIDVNNGLYNVEMQAIEGFTLLDWSKVIERATNIHTVCTAINYVLEILDLSAKEIHLYLRQPDEKNYENIIYLLTKNYIFH